MYSLHFNDLNLEEFWFTSVILAHNNMAIISLRLLDKKPSPLSFGITKMMSSELLDHFSKMTPAGLSLMRGDLVMQGKYCLTRSPIQFCESDRCLRK